jgi:hypothetical protein
MNKIKQKFGLLFIPLAFLACKDKNEDITDTVNKNGSIETAVHITHIDSARDEMITTHKVWVKKMYTRQLNTGIPAIIRHGK